MLEQTVRVAEFLLPGYGVHWYIENDQLIRQDGSEDKPNSYIDQAATFSTTIQHQRKYLQGKLDHPNTAVGLFANYPLYCMSPTEKSDGTIEYQRSRLSPDRHYWYPCPVGAGTCDKSTADNRLKQDYTAVLTHLEARLPTHSVAECVLDMWRAFPVLFPGINVKGRAFRLAVWPQGFRDSYGHHYPIVIPSDLDEWTGTIIISKETENIDALLNQLEEDLTKKGGDRLHPARTALRRGPPPITALDGMGSRGERISRMGTQKRLGFSQLGAQQPFDPVVKLRRIKIVNFEGQPWDDPNLPLPSVQAVASGSVQASAADVRFTDPNTFVKMTHFGEANLRITPKL
ncbi:hypothetical protein Bbelb_019190 [Branchiostoma belcheri]|nr:hypothetical protein Bbelb_019190 [Branchiostoma belcheri]